MAYVTAALKSFISIFGKKIKIILAVFAAIAALLLVLALLLGLAHLVQYGLSAKNLNRVGEFIWSLKNNPLKIADAYREWYQVLAYLGKKAIFPGEWQSLFVADHSGVGDLAGAGGI